MSRRGKGGRNGSFVQTYGSVRPFVTHCLRAVFWENGKPAELNALVPADTTLDLQTACSINREGQITGIALAKGTANEYHAYLATPIISDEDSSSAAAGVEGANKGNAKTLQQWRFGWLASQRSRTE